MSVPAQQPDESWNEQHWARALAGRPDLAARLDAGDTTALAEMLELMPGVTARPSQP